MRLLILRRWGDVGDCSGVCERWCSRGDGCEEVGESSSCPSHPALLKAGRVTERVSTWYDEAEEAKNR